MPISCAHAINVLFAGGGGGAVLPNPPGLELLDGGGGGGLLPPLGVREPLPCGVRGSSAKTSCSCWLDIVSTLRRLVLVDCNTMDSLGILDRRPGCTGEMSLLSWAGVWYVVARWTAGLARGMSMSAGRPSPYREDGPRDLILGLTCSASSRSDCVERKDMTVLDRDLLGNGLALSWLWLETCLWPPNFCPKAAWAGHSFCSWRRASRHWSW